MTRTAPRLVAINAGLGDPSSTRLLVDRLAEQVVAEFARTGDGEPDVEIIDLRELAADLGRSMTVGFTAGRAREALDAVEAADALIVATPVFNASYSGLFKMFFDLVDVDGMTGTPVLIAATGGSPRHSMVLDHALRPLFAYLRAVVVPTGVYAASEDWAGASDGTTPLTDRIARAATELVRLVGPRPAADPASSGRNGTAREAIPRNSTEESGIANFARLLGEAHANG